MKSKTAARNIKGVTPVDPKDIFRGPLLGETAKN